MVGTKTGESSAKMWGTWLKRRRKSDHLQRVEMVGSHRPRMVRKILFRQNKVSCSQSRWPGSVMILLLARCSDTTICCHWAANSPTAAAAREQLANSLLRMSYVAGSVSTDMDAVPHAPLPWWVILWQLFSLEPCRWSQNWIASRWGHNTRKKESGRLRMCSQCPSRCRMSTQTTKKWSQSTG